MGRQVYPPGQGGCADQHLEMAFREQALRQASVRPQHPSMMDPKAFWEHFLHLLVSRALDLEDMVILVFGNKQKQIAVSNLQHGISFFCSHLPKYVYHIYTV